MTPLISESVIVILALTIAGLLMWIRLRERHWVRMIDAINQSWNNAYDAPAQGYPHTRVRGDTRGLPATALSLGRRSGREVA